MFQYDDIQYLDYVRPVKRRNSNDYYQQSGKRRKQVEQIYNLEDILQQTEQEKIHLPLQEVNHENNKGKKVIKSKTKNIKAQLTKQFSEVQHLSNPLFQQKDSAINSQVKIQKQPQFKTNSIQQSPSTQKNTDLIKKQQCQNKASTSSQAEVTENRQLKVYSDNFQLSKQKKLTELSGIIKQIKFALSTRKIQQFNADILFIPFTTLQLQFYPGKQLRPLLKRQISKMQKSEMKQGSVYITSNHEIKNYRFLAFLKISLQNLCENFAEGFVNMLTRHSKSNIHSLVIGLSKGELDVLSIYDGLKKISVNKNFRDLMFNFALFQENDYTEFAEKLTQKILSGND